MDYSSSDAEEELMASLGIYGALIEGKLPLEFVAPLFRLEEDCVLMALLFRMQAAPGTGGVLQRVKGFNLRTS